MKPFDALQLGRALTPILVQHPDLPARLGHPDDGVRIDATALLFELLADRLPFEFRHTSRELCDN